MGWWWWIDPDFIVAMGNRAGGIPIARAAEVNIQNSHMQYIVTWYRPLSSPPPPYTLTPNTPPPTGTASPSLPL